MENKTLKDLLLRLKRLRQRHFLTQEMFSEISGISYKYYQAIEAGRKKELRLSTLERLAGAYCIAVYQLLSPHLTKTRLIKKYRSGRPHYQRANLKTKKGS